jgi:hypothetical protein
VRCASGNECANIGASYRSSRGELSKEDAAMVDCIPREDDGGMILVGRWGWKEQNRPPLLDGGGSAVCGWEGPDEVDGKRNQKNKESRPRSKEREAKEKKHLHDFSSRRHRITSTPARYFGRARI